ncbi:hypothetical protein SDC9_152972 [bioreactor metagenome]|uniref:Flotillin C-terminal domain-containing protein n=2 Tax=root TaxID=1 RepID=A0A645EWZ1_9ZZZZ
MNKKADAYGRYNEAAVIEMLVSVLPSLAEKIAAPMGDIDTLTVISTDGAGEMPKQVTNGVVQTFQLLKDSTGIDLAKISNKYLGDDAAVPGSTSTAGAASRGEI